jgi:hypothetical protein
MRDVALAAAAKLPSATACAAVGARADQKWSKISQNFATHHWWAPDASMAKDGHRIGQFTGFGGPFHEPPKLTVIDDLFVVQSGDRRFTLCADAYGATLRAIDATDQMDVAKDGQETPSSVYLVDGKLQINGRPVALAFPTIGIGVFETSDSIVVSSPYSHSIHVFPKGLP